MSNNKEGTKEQVEQSSGIESALGKLFESPDSAAATFLRKLVSKSLEPADDAKQHASKKEQENMGSQSTTAVASLPREEASKNPATEFPKKERREAVVVANFMKNCEKEPASTSDERQFTKVLEAMKSIGSVASIGSIGSIGDIQDGMDDGPMTAFRKRIGAPKEEEEDDTSSKKPEATNHSLPEAAAAPSKSGTDETDEDRRLKEAALRIVKYMKSSDAERKEMDQVAMIANLLKSSESTNRKREEEEARRKSEQEMKQAMLAHFMRSAGSSSSAAAAARDASNKKEQERHEAMMAFMKSAGGKGASQKSKDEAALIAHFMSSAGSTKPADDTEKKTEATSQEKPVDLTLQEKQAPPEQEKPPAADDNAKSSAVAASRHGFTTTTTSPESKPKGRVDEAAMIAHFMSAGANNKAKSDASTTDKTSIGPALGSFLKSWDGGSGDKAPSTSFLKSFDLDEAALIAHIMKSAESSRNDAKEPAAASDTPSFDEFIGRLRQRMKDLEDAAILATYMKRAAGEASSRNSFMMQNAEAASAGATTTTNNNTTDEAAIFAHFLKSFGGEPGGARAAADGQRAMQAVNTNHAFAKSSAEEAKKSEDSSFISNFMKSCESDAGRAAFLSMMKSVDMGNQKEKTTEAELFASLMKSSDFSKKENGGEDAFIANFMRGFGKNDGKSSAGGTGNASVAAFMRSFDKPADSPAPNKSAEFLKGAGGSIFLSSQLSNIFNSHDWLPRNAEQEIDNNLVSRFLHSQTSEEVWNFLGRNSSVGGPAAAPQPAAMHGAPDWSRFDSQQRPLAPRPPPPPPTTTDWQRFYEAGLAAAAAKNTHAPAPYLQRTSRPTPAEEAAVALASITPRQQALIQDQAKVKKAPKRKRPRRSYEPENKVFVEVKDEDVLFGRGGRTNHNSGNKRYLAAKDAIQARYMAADKNEKTAISQELVDMVQGWGGRFLKLEKGTENSWYEVTNIMARKKASQSLREINTPEERAAKRARYAKKD